MSTRRDFLTGAACLGTAAACWVPLAPSYFSLPTAALFDGGPLPDWAMALAERHLRIWEEGDRSELSLEYASNPEWDFMGRTFLVLALANLSLRQPAARDRYLRVMDAAIDDTLHTERTRGFTHFLLGYGRRGGWVYDPAASVFVDGEVAAMLAARLLIEDAPALRVALQQRIDAIVRQMEAGPIGSAESYPDECWTFCNTFAVAAVKMADAVGIAVDGRFADRWLATARARLVHEETGLLVSSYRLDGRTLDGPEGSSLWLSASNLLLVDETFAREQYALGKQHLMRDFLGFGYAKEWPDSARGHIDVDSGPEVPWLRASPGSSGLAVLGARAFGDEATYAQLVSSLQLAAFPDERDGTLRYRASNQVGDAVLLYAASFGPLWDLVRRTVA